MSPGWHGSFSDWASRNLGISVDKFWIFPLKDDEREGRSRLIWFHLKDGLSWGQLQRLQNLWKWMKMRCDFHCPVPELKLKPHPLDRYGMWFFLQENMVQLEMGTLRNETWNSGLKVRSKALALPANQWQRSLGQNQVLKEVNIYNPKLWDSWRAHLQNRFLFGEIFDF